MTVEVDAQYISQLQSAWPQSRDLIREGDDHIRKIKEVLVRSFPNADTGLTAPFSYLNDLNTAISVDSTNVTANGLVTLSGSGLGLNANSGKITNISDPTDAADATNKKYVDAQILSVTAATGAGTQTSADYTNQEVTKLKNELTGELNTKVLDLQNSIQTTGSTASNYTNYQIASLRTEVADTYVTKTDADAKYYSATNRPYTMGVAAPSGGVNGDIYLQYKV